MANPDSKTPLFFRKAHDFLLTKSAVIIAVILTFIFSFRWRNCLPFSGFSPALDNIDRLGMIGRYLIYAREKFGFPLGVVHGLSFPFEAARMDRGPIFLFALFFKILGRIYPPFLQFDYLVLAELVGFFATAYFAVRLFQLFSIRNFWVLLLAATFVSLSPTLLFRSSEYYGYTFIVLNFPLLMMTAYSFIRLCLSPTQLKYRLFFVVVFAVMATIDLYLLFSATVMVGTAGLFLILHDKITHGGPEEKLRIRTLFFLFVAGLLSSLLTFWLIGNQNHFETPDRNLMYRGRDATTWGYGGGFGGGFHVADVFSVFTANPITTGSTAPPSLIMRWNVPVLSEPLQPGQYEGFNFIGTVPLLLIFSFLAVLAFRWLRSPVPMGQKILAGKKRILDGLNQPLLLAVTAVGVGCFCLYSLSWGYILHVFGHRFNDVTTPSFILGYIYPKFMFSRSLGRLGFSFSMMVSLLAAAIAYRTIKTFFSSSAPRVFLGVLFCTFLFAIHLVDIADYLKPPSKVVQGNELAKVFSDEDIETLKKVTQSKVAVMLEPALLSDMPWNKIGLSIAYLSQIPVSGATMGFGENPSELQHYSDDLQSIKDGDVKKLLLAYGAVIIATNRHDSPDIMAKANVPLAKIELKSQDVVLLIPL